jgi:hypothetical protein
MHILSKHKELSKHTNIHEIAETFGRNFASMYEHDCGGGGKGKPDLKKRCLTIPRQKSSCPTYFVCHPYEILTKISQDNKRNYIGIEKLVP